MGPFAGASLRAGARIDSTPVKSRLVTGATRWIGLLFAALLLLHSANYLYFFVDDEAIPYVFAQNLLNGKGLRYNSFEGRVEGYSDFLHVLAATAILGTVRLLHLDKVAVFEINTIWSLACGAAIVWLTCGMVRRLPGIRAPGLVAGMSFLVLAGPLAVWSCSSLETATFALLITGLTAATLTRPRDSPIAGIATACAIAALLTRVDGFVYVGAVTGSALIVGDARRRRAIIVNVVLPSLAVFAAYNVWRVWYFGSVLPAPVATKVWPKLQVGHHLLMKAPPQNYAREFYALYGVAPLVVLCGTGLAWVRTRTATACAVAAATVTAYLAVVGDWMFGFRFFLPVLPWLALLIAHSISVVTTRGRRFAGWGMAVICVVWFSAVAVTFYHRYAEVERKESWLAHPSLDPNLHFARYYSLVSRGVLQPGTRTAYDQAGFVPFMLDLDNIDSLGLCSRFFADLPTTDVFLTDVGRYEPPTNKPVHKAGEAYLLYRDPAWVIYPDDLLRHANHDTIPDGLFGGYYRFAFMDAAQRNVVYARTGVSVEPFKIEPRHFLENLAHVTHIRRASVNDAAIDPDHVGEAFPWLREGTDRVTVAPEYSADVVFAKEDEAVYEVYVDLIAPSRAVTVTITLFNGGTVPVHRESVDLEANQNRTLYTVLPAAVRARRVRVDAVSHEGTARLSIEDLRVQGQTRALAQYVTRMLRFPAR